MNPGRAKKIRRMLNERNIPNVKLWNRAYKVIKRAHKKSWLKNNIPKVLPLFSKKQHSGESLMDFRIRRKACNKKRRLREKTLQT